MCSMRDGKVFVKASRATAVVGSPLDKGMVRGSSGASRPQTASSTSPCAPRPAWSGRHRSSCSSSPSRSPTRHRRISSRGPPSPLYSKSQLPKNASSGDVHVVPDVHRPHCTLRLWRPQLQQDWRQPLSLLGEHWVFGCCWALTVPTRTAAASGPHRSQCSPNYERNK